MSYKKIYRDYAKILDETYKHKNVATIKIKLFLEYTVYFSYCVL